MRKKNIIKLVISYSKGTLSTEEKKELKNFLAASPDNSKTFNHYRHLFYHMRSSGFLGHVEKEEAWKKIHFAINKPKSKIRRLSLLFPYAAALIIIGFVSIFLIEKQSREIDFSKKYDFAELVQKGNKNATLTLANGAKIKLLEQEEQQISERDGTQITKDSTNKLTYQSSLSVEKEALLYNTITVPRGGEYALTLSDGTKVRMNANSELRYPVNFVRNKREVYLVGEAYFEVAHRKHDFFTVHVHDSEVKVLGTKFNISAYEGQEFIATTLEEGKVEVNHLCNSQTLVPGYQSTIIRGQSGIEVQAVDTRLYTSWVNGVYEFENMELEYIMAQLSRWYDVKFFFTEKEFKHIRFTGAIKRDKPFEFALEMIEKIADVRFAVKDKHIIVGRQ